MIGVLLKSFFVLFPESHIRACHLTKINFQFFFRKANKFIQDEDIYSQNILESYTNGWEDLEVVAEDAVKENTWGSSVMN